MHYIGITIRHRAIAEYGMRSVQSEKRGPADALSHISLEAEPSPWHILQKLRRLHLIFEINVIIGIVIGVIILLMELLTELRRFQMKQV